MRRSITRGVRPYLPDIGILFALVTGNAVILFPYLAIDFSAHPWNNDYVYISAARLLRQYGFGWNPLWFGGHPNTYTYPPLFHLLVILLPVDSLGRAFHLISGFSYLMVPVALYVLGKRLFDARLPAVTAAAAWSLLPSTLYLSRHWAGLAGPLYPAPWPFVSLVVHEEGPHLLGLALALLTLSVAWKGSVRMAAVGTASVLLTNWTAAVGLMIALGAIAFAQARQAPARACGRVIASALTGYGLSAFWITPAYALSAFVIASSWGRYEEHHPAPWSVQGVLVVGACLAPAAAAALTRIPRALAFALAWTGLAAAPVMTFTLAANHVITMPWRYAIELHTAAILLLAAISTVGRWWRVAVLTIATGVLLAALPRFPAGAWKHQPASVPAESLYSYGIAKRLERAAGKSRVLVAGELAVSLNAWTDVRQAGGAHPSASNLLMAAVGRHLSYGCRATPESTAMWLRALGTTHVLTHGPASPEHFHRMAALDRFASFPVAWSAGDDVLYELPPPPNLAKPWSFRPTLTASRPARKALPTCPS